MQKLNTLEMLPVWADPEHLVETAVFIVEGHKLSILPIVSGNRVIGYVSASTLRQSDKRARVGDLARPFVGQLEGEMNVRQAAAAFVRDDLDVAPVFDNGKFLGLVTSNLLLKVLGQSWDPLTGLSWPDRLREWGVDQLRHGRELTILFLDLDGFAGFNKRHGHAAGDRLLQRVGAELSEAIDLNRDLLVRHGGDEFMVATLRGHEETLELAQNLKDATLDIREFAQPIRFSVGVSGGKRTRERDNTHYASMLENLITLAIADCASHKESKAAAVQPELAILPPSSIPTAAVVSTPTPIAPTFVGPEDLLPQGPSSNPAPMYIPSPDPIRAPQVQDHSPGEEPAIEVVTVQGNVEDGSATQVILRVDGRVVGGVHQRGETGLDQSVAAATGHALEAAFPGIMINVDEVSAFDEPDGSQLISVFGKAMSGNRSVTMTGSSKVGASLAEAVSTAVVTAFKGSGLGAAIRRQAAMNHD